MNTFEKIAFDGLKNRLNKFLEKKAKELKEEKKNMYFIYKNETLYYTYLKSDTLKKVDENEL